MQAGRTAAPVEVYEGFAVLLGPGLPGAAGSKQKQRDDAVHGGLPHRGSVPDVRSEEHRPEQLSVLPAVRQHDGVDECGIRHDVPFVSGRV